MLKKPKMNAIINVFSKTQSELPGKKTSETLLPTVPISSLKIWIPMLLLLT